MHGTGWHHEATLPCHQQKQQTVTAAWAGCKVQGNYSEVLWSGSRLPW